MKKVLLILSFILISFAVASAFLESFTAKSDGSQIRLEWKTSSEVSVKYFIVERKTVNGNFIPVTEIAAKGSNSTYSFTDDNIYKTASSAYVYRLKIVDQTETSAYSKELMVSHSLSDIKRTWGSIKAMFR